jgi:DNA-binding XRE family transcriptional regulator
MTTARRELDLAMSETIPLTGYDELIEILTAVPTILRETRRRKAMNMAQAGDAVGVAASTIMRWEKGDAEPGIQGIIKILRWAAT